MSSPMAKKTKKVVFSFLLSTSILSLKAFAVANTNYGELNNGYCIAIRGNGELAPAHWGALAQTVETFGIPAGMAGGSSGSISTFLMESLMMNPAYRAEPDLTKKRQILSLMIKSLKGFIETQLDQPKVKNLFNTLKLITEFKNQKNKLSSLVEIFKQYNTVELLTQTATRIEHVLNILNDLVESEILYGPQVKSFHEALKDFKLNNKSISTLRNEYNKLNETLKVFGSFNAKDDKALFFRGGIVNFPALANAIGFVADFYSQKNNNVHIEDLFKNFINACQEKAVGKAWDEISPECQTKLSKSIISFSTQIHHFNQDKKYESLRLQDPIGTSLPALISTSLAINDSAQKLINLKNEYDQNKVVDENAYSQLNLNPEEIRFGYWGQKTHLDEVQKFFSGNPNNILSQIDKSKRFLSLGAEKWLTALSLSPAEPGLSSMIPFELNGKVVVSMGGWSDLHPVPVLKAMNSICKKVVYVTRKGGDAIFGQGIAKRLLNFEFPDWDLLDGKDSPKNLTNFYNNTGRSKNDIPEAFNELWSRMFNLANPESSFSVSLKNSDAVVCTDWNSFDIKTDFTKMIKEAYLSPIILNNLNFNPLNKNSNILRSEQNSDWKNETVADKNDSTRIYPKYAGCYSYEN